VETLELLEELLLEYGGTVLLVSHDRAFVNNVVTSTLVFENEGRIAGYAGGYDDWLIQRPENESADKFQPASRKGKKKAGSSAGKKKMGYMEKRELEALPEQIEALENRQQELFETLSAQDFYKQSSDAIASVKTELAQVQAELDRAFVRWEELEGKSLKS
jgi:ATP-binding cassette subfamily F protein uup